ncbi:MAG: hypothetical protein KC621_27330, partial [Myxococcales bacterium]|nr:hypothetical protein [Myxococcales bacterium]
DTSSTHTGTPITTEAPWEGCPDASALVADDWAGTLTSTGALWCAEGEESHTLEDGTAHKGQLLVRAGVWPLPDDVVQPDAPYRLPLCVLLDGGAHPDASEVGTISAYPNEGYAGDVRWDWRVTQPMSDGASVWELSLRAQATTADASTPGHVEMSATWTDPWADQHLQVQLQRGTYPSFDAWWSFVPCDFEGAARDETSTVVFDGGEASFQLRIGTSPADTEPAMFVHAEGTLDGTPFVQDDYWKLLYAPAHHHFTRDFGVLFDAPIGSACGLKVKGVAAGYSAGTTVELADCAMGTLEARTVTSTTTGPT